VAKLLTKYPHYAMYKERPRHSTIQNFSLCLHHGMKAEVNLYTPQTQVRILRRTIFYDAVLRNEV